MTSAKILRLPRTMDKWPWQRAINPHYEEVSAESDAWFHSFKAFTKTSQEAFDKCDFGRLASLAYPTATREQLRAGCDLMNLFFVIDEYTDVEDASAIPEMVDIVKDALHDPHKPRPESEIILGQITKEFWQSVMKIATPLSQKHFIESFSDYLDTLVIQAADRDENVIRSIDEYMRIRSENIGLRPSCMPAETYLDLPDDVFYHPVMKELYYITAELIALDNDIASYNREQAMGDDKFNIVTVVMYHLNVDVDEALDWTAHYHEQVQRKFFDALHRLPSFGPKLDKQVKEFILHLANWPRCNECWNFESGRYFGTKGSEVEKTRCVPLMPPLAREHTAKKHDVVILDIACEY
ncbi:hypothetical protein AX17_002250 [Amanita inopinata Kibby_2008]|nr:hypothetical protein AX17_002250 [Amanita inopinata Kibby_2008]